MFKETVIKEGLEASERIHMEKARDTMLKETGKEKQLSWMLKSFHKEEETRCVIILGKIAKREQKNTFAVPMV